ncbi:MAG: hypothetical protein IKF36_02235 [Bacilli bacterium]|nr:hypothetical protein [Bacilli bacterium]
MKKRILILLILFTVIITGCGYEEPEVKVEKLTDKATRVSVDFNDQKLPESTKLAVTEVATDYSGLSSEIQKSIAYDISLKADSDVKLKDEVTVYLNIPVDFNRRFLAVYLVDNNKIKKKYEVQISKDVLTFSTKELGIFVLAEVTEEQIKRTEVPKINSEEE